VRERERKKEREREKERKKERERERKRERERERRELLYYGMEPAAAEATELSFPSFFRESRRGSCNGEGERASQ
jgi:hypothetical protein